MKLFFKLFRYANAPSGVADLTTLPIPPAPIVEARSTRKEGNSEWLKMCPICRTKRKNETLVPISGYVYCFKCIILHLRSADNVNGSCPMTGLPVTEDDLIRIFPPGSE